jgi:uncharacterized protein (UPF0335 family)
MRDIDDINYYMLGRSKLKPEMGLQCALMSWLDAKHPSIRELTFASTGGVRTHIRQAALMKSAGYKKGTPDIFIAIPQADYHGLFIELKTEKGQASKEQKEVCRELSKQGYDARICKGWSVTIKTIESYCHEWIKEHHEERTAYNQIYSRSEY